LEKVEKGFEKNMNKEKLVEEVQKISGLSKKDAKKVVEGIFEAIINALAKGEEVAIAGFGTFRVVKRAAREARNPKTGEKIHVPAKVVPKFRPAKALKEAVK